MTNAQIDQNKNKIMFNKIMRSNDQPFSSRSRSYIKEKQQPKAGIQQKFWGFCTNLVYKLKGINEQVRPNVSVVKAPTIYLLGKKCKDEDEARMLMQEAIWFTYRTNFLVSERYHSDIGWGCLIRVGQMLLAASLLKYIRSQKLQNNSTRELVIAAFLDEKGEHVKYSLNKIVEYARRKLGKQPGSWFYITEISWVLSHLHNNDPLNGTQYLRLAFFGETVIYLDELYEALGLDICRCLEPRIKCLKCSSASKYQNHFKDTTSAFKKHPNVTFTTSSKSRQLERHLLIIVSTRLSEEQVEPEKYSLLLRLFDLKCSMGIIGGIKSRALFLIGRHDQSLLYLDPHLAQQFVNRTTLSRQLKTFSCSNYRVMTREQLDPSVGLAFYLRNEDDIEELVMAMHTMRKESKHSTFMSYMWTNECRPRERRDSEIHSSYEQEDDMENSFIA